MSTKCRLTKGCIIINTVILGAVASASHFLYGLSGENTFIGTFNPINESVWEHLKFMFFPFIIWWIVMYLINRKKCSLDLTTFLTVSSVSVVINPILMMILYYGYTGVLGKNYLPIDIFLTFFSYFLSLNFANHLLKHAKPKKWHAIIGMLLVLIMMVMFIVFTFYPPQLPLFFDPLAKG